MEGFLRAVKVVLGGVAALVLGALVSVGASALATARVGWSCVVAAAQVLGPSAPTDHLGLAPPDDAGPDRDPGYRSYLLGPVLWDAVDVALVTAVEAWDHTVSPAFDAPSMVRWLIERWSDPFGHSDGQEAAPAFLLPSLVCGVLGTVAGALVGSVLVLAVLLVFAVLLTAVVAGALLCAAALRAFEMLLLGLRGITIECGNCHRRVGAPAYDCDQCEPTARARHRDLTPGRLGVLTRTCRCGNALPTLLAQGKSALTAYCEHAGCNHPLPVNGLTAPTAHLPVVAGVSAGKSLFMLSAVAELDTPADSLEFADEDAAAEPRELMAVVRKGELTAVPKTVAARRLRPLVFYHGTTGTRDRRLVYLYDAAGELYARDDVLDTLRFLPLTAGVVLVVDPFAIPAVTRTLTAVDTDLVKPSPSPPWDEAERFTRRLRECLDLPGGRRLDASAAVVVTKCDELLARGPVAHPYEGLRERASRALRSRAVRDWLVRNGAVRMVGLVEGAYGRGAYFAVSALDVVDPTPRRSVRTGGAVGDDDPSAPLRWLLHPEAVE